MIIWNRDNAMITRKTWRGNRKLIIKEVVVVRLINIIIEREKKCCE